MTDCPVCEAKESSPVVERRGYRYVRCRNCRSVYLYPMPSPDEVESFYQNPAYFEGDEEAGYRSYADMHKALAPHFRRRLRGLADGTAWPWMVARTLWRAVRLLGWAWQKVARSQDDIFATLEALACRPE